MKGRATCFGAATIVNAMATGRGAAFGIALPVEAEVELGGETIEVAAEEDPAMVGGLVATLLAREGRGGGARVAVRSRIPAGRGLKSSSAVANAVALATLRALGVRAADLDVINDGVDACLAAGVSLTGAFDDACACFFGGIVLTDNRQRNILAMDAFDEPLKVVLHIPRERQGARGALPSAAFEAIRGEVEEAFRRALRRDFYAALELNGRAYARALGLSLAATERARAAGAVAAGPTGAGPATVALCDPSVADAVAAALGGGDAEVRIVDLNTTSAAEAVP